ncbi:GNAT family N-acetyltransferase [Tenacibaculum ovolyticum]|uniref:GNAT family N-acetyltransferase n=1 Tax=Tenacibaculum ovolyticum TaxID=104270 RepID=UPI001F3E4792|nr:GNAT family N-acetyltransferase [Tenacibaculum ovolyticum]
MPYIFKPLNSNNIKDLTYLYKHIFGNTMTLKMVKSKFNTSYLRMGYFGHLAYDNEQPIAFHGAIPVLMQYNGVQEMAAQYGDAMTLPKYTGNGLFTKLGKLTDEQLKKAGIKFVWGFPNQNSEYGYLNKLDWNYKERMQRFNFKVSFPIEKFARKFSITNNLYNTNILKRIEKHKTSKRIKGSVYIKENVVSTYRNHSYYKYKSFTNNFTIDIDGVLFWVKIKNGLLIGDIEASSEENFFLSFEKLKKLAMNNGIGEINIQASPNTFITDLMKNYTNDSLESWVIGFKNFSSKFPLEKLKLTLGDLDTY